MIFLSMDKILVAIDFTEVSKAVLARAKKLVLAFDARLCIIHVEPDGDVYAREEDNLEFHLETSHKIDAVRKEFNEANIFPYFKEASGLPAKCILNECERFKPDVLILGAYRYSKLIRIWSDNLREEMIAKAPCSVLLVHPDDEV